MDVVGVDGKFDLSLASESAGHPPDTHSTYGVLREGYRYQPSTATARRLGPGALISSCRLPYSLWIYCSFSARQFGPELDALQTTTCCGNNKTDCGHCRICLTARLFHPFHFTGSCTVFLIKRGDKLLFTMGRVCKLRMSIASPLSWYTC